MVDLCGKTRKILLTLGVTMRKKWIHQVSDLEKLLYCFPDTPVETHRSLLYEVSVSRAQTLGPSHQPGETLCKKNNDRVAGESLLVIAARGNLAHNSPHNTQTTTWLSVRGEPPSITSVGKDPVQSNQQNSGSVSATFSPQTIPRVPPMSSSLEVPKKKDAKRIEFEKLPNSTTFVIWKMIFKSEVCSRSSMDQ